MGLWEALSNFRNSIVDEKSKIKSGLGGLEDIIRKNVKIDGIKNGLERLETRIEENLKITKYIMPYVLMARFSSNIYGRIGSYVTYYILIRRSLAKGNVADAVDLMQGRYGKAPLPLIVGAITGAAGLIIGILLGDAYSLWHHNTTISNLEQTINQDNQTIAILDKEINTYQNEINQDNQTISSLLHELQNDTATINQYDQTIVNLEQTINQYKQTINQDNQTISNLEQTIAILDKEINTYQNEITNLQDQVQNLQNSQALEKILFGNSSKDISIIQVNSVNINNGTVDITGIAYPSDKEVTLEMPLQYAENNGVNIQNLYNASQQNNWNTYIALDRADLQYLTLNNQNGTTVIDIQPNEPLNIGEYATPVNASTLYNVLNHLTKYNIVIQDSIPVYNNHDALWGYKLNSNSSVVIDFSNNYQYNLAEKMINIADQIINSPDNQNPTHSGIIDTYSIFSGTISGYGGYAQYNVGNIYPLIVLKPQQGNTIPDAVSS